MPSPRSRAAAGTLALTLATGVLAATAAAPAVAATYPVDPVLADVATAYAAELGATTAPSAPVTAVTRSTGIAQTFVTGTVVARDADPATPTTYAVTGPFDTAYRRLGGPTGALGLPAGRRFVVPTKAQEQRFELGAAVLPAGAGTARVVQGEIWKLYLAQGSAAGPLGHPLFDQMPQAPGVIQYFAGGRVFSSWMGTYSVTGPILSRFNAVGGVDAAGVPVGAQTRSASGCVQQQFAKLTLRVVPAGVSVASCPTERRWVGQDRIVLRATGATTGQAVRALYKGTTLTVPPASDGSWVKVGSAYASAAQVTRFPVSNVLAATWYVGGVRTQNVSYYRSGPGFQYPIVGTLYPGTQVSGGANQRPRGVTPSGWVRLDTGWVNFGVLYLVKDVLPINGRLTKADLCVLPSWSNTPDYTNVFITPTTPRYVSCEGVAAWLTMNAAFSAKFGTNLRVDRAYRPIEEQIYYDLHYDSQSAEPGYSTHGLAGAIDFRNHGTASLPYKFGGTYDQWLTANSKDKFGWDRRYWNDKYGSFPDQPHYEFVG